MPSENQNVILSMIGVALLLARQNSDLYALLLASGFFLFTLYVSHPNGFRLAIKIILVKIFDLLEIIFRVLATVIHYIAWFVSAIILLIALYLVLAAKRCLEGIAKALVERLQRMRGTARPEDAVREPKLLLPAQTADREDEQEPYEIEEDSQDIPLDSRVQVGRGRRRRMLRDLYETRSQEMIVDSAEAKEMQNVAPTGDVSEYEAEVQLLNTANCTFYWKRDKKQSGSDKQANVGHTVPTHDNQNAHNTVSTEPICTDENVQGAVSTEPEHIDQNTPSVVITESKLVDQDIRDAHITGQHSNDKDKHTNIVSFQPKITVQENDDFPYDWDSEAEFPPQANDPPRTHTASNEPAGSPSYMPSPTYTVLQDDLYDDESGIEFQPYEHTGYRQVSEEHAGYQEVGEEYPIALSIETEPEPEEDVLYELESEESSPEPRREFYQERETGSEASVTYDRTVNQVRVMDYGYLAEYDRFYPGARDELDDYDEYTSEELGGGDDAEENDSDVGDPDEDLYFRLG